MEGLKVSSIELTTKEGVTVKLTIDEARALLAQLSELFGTNEKSRTVPMPIPMPYPIPVYPLPRPILIPGQWPSPWRPSWEVTCGSSSKHLTRSDGSGLAVSYRGELTS
jgi:hypothetical protein